MTDTTVLLRDAILRNNLNVIADARTKLVLAMNVLGRNTRTEKIYNLLDYVLKCLNTIATNANINNQQLNNLMVTMGKMNSVNNISNQLNSMNLAITEMRNNMNNVNNLNSSVLVNPNANYGSYDFPDGKYVGELVGGLPNGRGTTTCFNGDKYVGEMRDGKYEG